MMPASGTFKYELRVPDRRWATARAYTPGASPPLLRRDPLRDDRLVGYSPEVWILSDRIILAATKRRFASCRAAVVTIHPDVIALVSGGDVLHFAGTPNGGLAFAVARGPKLVIAAGALSALTGLSGLGVLCELSGPRNLRDRAEVHATVTIGGRSHRFEGPEELELQGYHVRYHHGVLQETIPGTDECLVIVQAADFPALSASEATPFVGYVESIAWGPDSTRWWRGLDSA